MKISLAKCLLGMVSLLFVVFLHAPMAMIVLFSFNASNFVAFPLKGLTFGWYEKLLTDGPLFAALGNSLAVAAPVAVCSTVVGLMAAKAFTHYRVPGRSVLLGTLMLPIAIPTFILGIALLTFVRQVLDLELSLFIVGLAHTMICLPYSIFTLMARLEGFDHNLEQASMDLGESPFHTFRRITIPLALPGIVSSLMLSFIVSLDEFMLAFFLAGSRATLPLYMMGQMRFSYSLPSMLALGTLIFLVSVGLVVAAELLRRRGLPE